MRVKCTGNKFKIENGVTLIECVTVNGMNIYVQSDAARCDCTTCEDNSNNECLIISITGKNKKCQEMLLN